MKQKFKILVRNPNDNNQILTSEIREIELPNINGKYIASDEKIIDFLEETKKDIDFFYLKLHKNFEKYINQYGKKSFFERIFDKLENNQEKNIKNKRCENEDKSN